MQRKNTNPFRVTYINNNFDMLLICNLVYVSEVFNIFWQLLYRASCFYLHTLENSISNLLPSFNSWSDKQGTVSVHSTQLCKYTCQTNLKLIIDAVRIIGCNVKKCFLFIYFLHFQLTSYTFSVFFFWSIYLPSKSSVNITVQHNDTTLRTHRACRIVTPF